MTITASELYVLVAEELGIISGQNALQPDDSDKIARRTTHVMSWLLEEGLAYFPISAVPSAAALPLAQIIAGQCADLFGRGPKSEDPYAMADSGYAALERHCSKRSAKEPVQAEYF